MTTPARRLVAVRRATGPLTHRSVHAVLVTPQRASARYCESLCGAELPRHELTVVSSVRDAGTPCTACLLVASVLAPARPEEPADRKPGAWLDYYRRHGWDARLGGDGVLLHPSRHHRAFSLDRDRTTAPLLRLAERRSLPPLFVAGDVVVLIVVATGIPYATPPELREAHHPVPLPTTETGWCVPPSTADQTCRDINVVHACGATPRHLALDKLPVLEVAEHGDAG